MDQQIILDFYRCKIINVVDGDTVDAIVDTRFNTTTTARLRLLGVDTPELRSSDPEERVRAKQAKQAVVDWVLNSSDEEWPFVIWTAKSDSFGRYLAVVWPNMGTYCNFTFTNLTLNYYLVKQNHATIYRSDNWPDFMVSLEAGY